LFYATDREPAGTDGRHYQDRRGHVLRLGVARVTLGKEDMTWEEAKRISLLKERPRDYPLKVSDVQELGLLEGSVNAFTQELVDQARLPPAGEQFAAKVNAALAVSGRKDVYIYVHGYKVVFDNPLLVASELWHFLGYDGVFIAFAWPSTPRTLAYFADLETAALSAGNLRVLIEYLAEETDARRIHLIGYSAGTRLVTDALHQLALMQTGASRPGSASDYRIGHVVLTGSDVDRHLFGAYLVDGILDVADDITVYASAKDSALGVSRWVFRRQRLGQIPSGGMSAPAVNFLQENATLVIVNATDAPGAATGNGHAYFRQSPWTSSDILALLAFDLTPAERGLVQEEGEAVWTFPEDYIGRLRSAVLAAQFELP
jgi:esterase/lipase superfamily enzyme